MLSLFGMLPCFMLFCVHSHSFNVLKHFIASTSFSPFCHKRHWPCCVRLHFTYIQIQRRAYSLRLLICAHQNENVFSYIWHLKVPSNIQHILKHSFSFSNNSRQSFLLWQVLSVQQLVIHLVIRTFLAATLEKTYDMPWHFKIDIFDSCHVLIMLL